MLTPYLLSRALKRHRPTPYPSPRNSDLASDSEEGHAAEECESNDSDSESDASSDSLPSLHHQLAKYFDSTTSRLYENVLEPPSPLSKAADENADADLEWPHKLVELAVRQFERLHYASESVTP